MSLKKISNKNISTGVMVLIIFVLSFGVPLSVYAAETTSTNTTNGNGGMYQSNSSQGNAMYSNNNGNSNSGSNQRSVSVSGGTNTNSGANSGYNANGGSSGGNYNAYDAVGGIATCSVGQVLGRLISSAVSQAINAIAGYAVDKVVDTVVDAVTKVPVADSTTHTNTAATAGNTAIVNAKTTGGGNAGGITGFFKNMLASLTPSWDSIMFCIVNEIMTYITQSTIQWINSGFNGNPVFIQNPRQVFQNIADQETSSFANEIANGTANIKGQVVNGTANAVANGIIRIAEPLKQGAIQSLVGSSNSGFGDASSPTMDREVIANYNRFVSGQQWMGFGAFMQVSRPENNYYGVNSMVAAENARRIALEQHNQELQMITNGGYRSKTTCPSGHTRQDGSCDPQYAQATVQGNQIRDELQNRSMMKYMRVSFAKDFDSVVTALVNQLVKIAVDKVFESAR